MDYRGRREQEEEAEGVKLVHPENRYDNIRIIIKLYMILLHANMYMLHLL